MAKRSRHDMWQELIGLSAKSELSLQKQLRTSLAALIVGRYFSLDTPLPSSRALSKGLKVSRSTVSLAYQWLVDDGYLISHERRGFFVNPDILETEAPVDTKLELANGNMAWHKRLKYPDLRMRNIHKPRDWYDYSYPFIFGQLDPDLIPVTAWRECLRQAQSLKGIAESGNDLFDQDDDSLVKQVINRVLPKRGIWCKPENVLITLGAQYALALIAKLLINPTDVVGIENPGYPDARNLFQLESNNIKLLEVDSDGLQIDDALNDCQYLYVTPSFQSPTTVTLPEARRQALFDKVNRHDIVIIEDDYETEAAFGAEPIPALKSQDKQGRVIYCGSLSKCLAPGLRLGFIVADPTIIEQARALRRLTIRHPPPLIESAVSTFIKLGHYDSHINRLAKVYQRRWSIMAKAIDECLPFATRRTAFGGTSFWITGPKNLDAEKLALSVTEYGILIEPGSVHFGQSAPPTNCFRLGFAAITDSKIRPGIQLLAEQIRRSTE